MADYFGNNTDGTNNTGAAGTYAWNNPSDIAYTCPNSGTQIVVELATRCYTTDAGNVRVALYTTAGVLVCQAATESAAPGSADWVVWTSFTDAVGDPITDPEITGGTDYILMVTADGGTVYVRYNAVTSGYARYAAGDLTGGFPADVSGSFPGSATGAERCIRCGVDPAAGGLSIPIAPISMYHYNNMRGRTF